MKIVEITNGSWLQCHNEHASEFANQKLHVYLPVNLMDRYRSLLYERLKSSVERGIIPAFKILNIGDSKELERALFGQTHESNSSERVTFAQNTDTRLLNSPVTIYLHDDFSPTQIADLCRTLENELKDVPAYDHETLSVADLPISSHTTFRQEKLYGEYKAIADASEATLKRLETEGRASQKYQQLQNTLQEKRTEDEKRLKEIDREKENFIQGFYNSNYRHFKDEIESENPNRQFKTACLILGIDITEIRKKPIKEWKTIIGKHYRPFSLQVHPDKVGNTTLTSTKERARAIFDLVTSCRDLLEKMAEDPSILNEQELLKQVEHLPEYQYELAQGFVDHPGFYVSMASSSAEVILKQNWDFVRTAEPIQASDDSLSGETSHVIQVYKPQLQLYTGSKQKTLKLSGDEAFYRLYMANALPRRFYDRQYQDSIFNAEPREWTEAQKRLFKKVITIPKFMGAMDSMGVFYTCQKATEAGIVNVGVTRNEILLYFYNNMPETLYGRGIEKWYQTDSFQGTEIPHMASYASHEVYQKTYDEQNTAYKERRATFLQTLSDDFDKLADAILAKPENLHLIQSSALSELAKNSPRLRIYILSNEALSEKIGHYVYELCAQKFRPGKPDSQPEDFFDITITELLGRNIAFLSIYSDKHLQQLKQFIQNNPDTFPQWLTDTIKHEEDIRQGRTIFVSESIDPEENIDSVQKRKTPKQYIKEEFYKGNETFLPFLNIETLLWLKKETHWSQWIPVVGALLVLNEQSAAEDILQEICSNLGLPISENASIEQQLSDVKKQTTAIKEINNQWKKEIVTALLEEYRFSLTPQGVGDIKSIQKKIGLFSPLGDNEIRAIRQKAEHFYNQQFESLNTRLSSGERSPEFKEEWKQLFLQVERTGLDCCSPDNLRGSRLYRLMRTVIGGQNASSWGRESDPKGGFIFDTTPNILEDIEKLYELYTYLPDGNKHFYNHLVSHYSCKNTLDDEQVRSDHFDYEKIKRYLLNYAENELAVFAEGQRAAASYKTSWYVDSQNVKPYILLNNLFHRLGEENRLQQVLPQAYQKLADAEKELQRQGPSHTFLYGVAADSKEVNDDTEVASRPLLRYIAIRKHQKAVNPALEDLAIRNQLLLLSKKYRALKSQFMGADNAKVAFRDNIDIGKIRDNNTIEDTQVVSKKTEKMLNALATLLESSSHAESQALLQELKEDSILSDYLHLSKLKKEEISKITVGNTVKNIRRKTLLLESNPPVPLITNAHTVAPKEDHSSMILFRPENTVGKIAVTERNLLKLPLNELTETEKRLTITRNELVAFLATYDSKDDNEEGHRNRGFFYNRDLDGSTTIKNLRHLLVSSKNEFALSEIREAVHQKNIGTPETSGTDFLLHRIINRFHEKLLEQESSNNVNKRIE